MLRQSNWRIEMKYGWVLKFVGRWSPRERVLRIARLMFNRPWGHGWCARQFSVALTPRLWRWHREDDGLLFTVFGLRLHWKESHGGYFV